MGAPLGEEGMLVGCPVGFPDGLRVGAAVGFKHAGYDNGPPLCGSNDKIVFVIKQNDDGIFPVKEFCSIDSRTRNRDSSPRELGIVPTREFRCTKSSFTRLIVPI